jgi:two-component system LytT family response regulator
MQVIDAIEGERIPATIFVTAHREYAIEAFEANAVDYILKPFGRERLERPSHVVKPGLRAPRTDDTRSNCCRH